MVRSVLRSFALALTVAVSGLLAPASAEIVTLHSAETSQSVGTDSNGLLTSGGRGPLYLEMIHLGGNRVAFRDQITGRYLRAGVGSNTELMAASPHVRGWETFDMIREGSYVRFRSVQNGLWVQTTAARPRLNARGQGSSRAQLFRLSVVRPDLAPAPAPGSRPLPFAGRWRLERAYEHGNPVALEPAWVRRATLSIGRTGTSSGSTACNDIDLGIYPRLNGWRVGDIFVHRMRCYGDQGEVERLFLQAMRDVQYFDLASGGRQLHLRDSHGRIAAVFNRD